MHSDSLYADPQKLIPERSERSERKTMGREEKKGGRAKTRLDLRLVELGLAPAREKAAALIMAGEVRVNGQVVSKADFPVSAQAQVEVSKRYPYVSRGAFKIEKAIREFGLPVRNRHILDVGISTGGFSDYLLQQGAARIIGVDVTIAQVSDRLRRDPRVTLIEKNARYLTRGDVGEDPDLIVVDLSFISIAKVLPALSEFAATPILALVKPQFEAPRGRVGKGGVVRRADTRLRILLELKQRLANLNFFLVGFTSAGIKGKRGNQEYFFLLRYGKSGPVDDRIITDSHDV